MTRVSFDFGGAGEVSGSFAFAREPGCSGQLRVGFGSNAIRRPDGSGQVFLLEFNNIGKTDPIVFLESLDQGYLNDKLTNLSARSCDLFRRSRTSAGSFRRRSGSSNPSRLGRRSG